MVGHSPPGPVNPGMAGIAADAAPPGTEHESENPPPSTPPKQTRRYGHYTDGKWYCNCKPPARAKYLTVKKEGINKDRCFYSCRDKDHGCDFFCWAEEADERAAALGNGGCAAVTTPRSRDQSIRKFFPLQGQEMPIRGQETPNLGQGEAMEVDGDESPSRPANIAVRQEEQQGGPQGKQQMEQHEEQQGKQRTDKPPTPPAPIDCDDPTTPIRRPRKRPREEYEGEYALPDFSSGEEEEVEKILSAASSRIVKSPPAVPAVTPTHHLGAPSSTPIQPATGSRVAIPTPSGRTSLGETRRRILSSNVSLPRDPTTPQHKKPDSPQPQTPHADTAASINADLDSLRALVSPRLDAPASKQLEALLGRISMKARSGASQREMLRGTLDRMERDVALLRGRNTALENEVRGLREERVRARGKLMEVWKET